MGSTPKPPSAPEFNAIDIPDTLAKALRFDIQGFQASDADFKSRFPGLVETRDNEISSAYNNLINPVDPATLRSYTQSNIEKALGVTGGGNLSAGLGQGSFAENIVGTGTAKNVLQQQDYDRAYFQSLIQGNPQRAFGLSGADVANLSIANTGGLNANNQLQYNSTIQGINAQGAAGVAQGQAIASVGSIISQLGALFPKTTSDKRLKTDIKVVGKSEMGIPIVEFRYKKKKGLPEGRFRGVLAQDVLTIKPNAVSYQGDYMVVDYSMIDVKHEIL